MGAETLELPQIVQAFERLDPIAKETQVCESGEALHAAHGRDVVEAQAELREVSEAAQVGDVEDVLERQLQRAQFHHEREDVLLRLRARVLGRRG
eukprot:scaffold1661_cov251-Pinguiococcus_pyrenoidosus.AAC.38